MIKASKLRLGNLFQTIEGKVRVKICELYLADKGADDNGYSCCNLEHNLNEYQAVSGKRDIEPIPLTPELFEKYGFVESSDMPQGYRTWYNSVYIYWHKNDVGFYKVGQHSIKIYYLHELQNVYFSLTGKELKIVN